MHLLNALAAGMNGAANGTAEIRVRGTSTYATTYSDHFGRTANTRGALQLDANGGIEAYVDQFVDIVVKDAAGLTVRQFTAGGEATAVGYRGPSFVGINPDTGASAINQPIAVKDALDKVRTSFGTTGFNVRFGGSDRLLYEVLTGLATFYNVKDPLYGALGDGSNDDTAEVQSAADAAEAAGGGIVFFPPGVYRISSAIALGPGVSVLGSGAACTEIKNYGAGVWFYVDGHDVQTFARRCFISDLRFTAGSSTSTTVLQYGDAQLCVERCSFGMDSGEGGTVTGTLIAGDGGATGDVLIRDCSFYIETANQIAVGSPDDASVTVSGCYFYTAATGTKFVSSSGDAGHVMVSDCRIEIDCDDFSGGIMTLGDGGASISNCKFILDVVTASASGLTCISTTGSGRVTVGGCTFTNPGADITANSKCMSAGTGPIVEGDNFFVGTNIYPYASGITAGSQFNSRETRRLLVTDNSATVAIKSRSYGKVELTRTNTDDQDITLEAAPLGSTFTLVVRNDSGSGSITAVKFPATGTTVFGPAADIAVGGYTLANSTAKTHTFVYTAIGWVQTAVSISVGLP